MIELDVTVPVEIYDVFEYFIHLGNANATHFEIVQKKEDVDCENSRYYVYSIICHTLEDQESKRRVEEYFHGMVCGMIFAYRYSQPNRAKSCSKDRFSNLAARLL